MGGAGAADRLIGERQRSGRERDHRRSRRRGRKEVRHVDRRRQSPIGIGRGARKSRQAKRFLEQPQHALVVIAVGGLEAGLGPRTDDDRFHLPAGPGPGLDTTGRVSA